MLLIPADASLLRQSGAVLTTKLTQQQQQQQQSCSSTASTMCTHSEPERSHTQQQQQQQQQRQRPQSATAKRSSTALTPATATTARSKQHAATAPLPASVTAAAAVANTAQRELSRTTAPGTSFSTDSSSSSSGSSHHTANSTTAEPAWKRVRAVDAAGVAAAARTAGDGPPTHSGAKVAWFCGALGAAVARQLSYGAEPPATAATAATTAAVVSGASRGTAAAATRASSPTKSSSSSDKLACAALLRAVFQDHDSSFSAIKGSSGTAATGTALCVNGFRAALLDLGVRVTEGTLWAIIDRFPATAAAAANGAGSVALDYEKLIVAVRDGPGAVLNTITLAATQQWHLGSDDADAGWYEETAVAGKHC
jgi:hypothetical protein